MLGFVKSTVKEVVGEGERGQRKKKDGLLRVVTGQGEE